MGDEQELGATGHVGCPRGGGADVGGVRRRRRRGYEAPARRRRRTSRRRPSWRRGSTRRPWIRRISARRRRSTYSGISTIRCSSATPTSRPSSARSSRRAGSRSTRPRGSSSSATVWSSPAVRASTRRPPMYNVERVSGLLKGQEAPLLGYQFESIKGVRAVDATTLRITTKYPDPLFLGRMASLMMVPDGAAQGGSRRSRTAPARTRSSGGTGTTRS